MCRKRSGATLIALAAAVLPWCGAYGGVPVPGMNLCGRVYGTDGTLLTDGQLVFTFTPDSGGEPVTVTATLRELETPEGLMSYAVLIPFEAAVDAEAVTPDCLAVSVAPLAYMRTARLEGTELVREDRIFLSVSDLGHAQRVDLGTAPFHTGDTNRDYRFALEELMAEIELFTATHGHEYYCMDWWSTAYTVEPDLRDCLPHSGDYWDGGADWTISLSELMRMVELFTATEDHAYYPDGTGEDGFRVGTAAKAAGIAKQGFGRDPGLAAVSRVKVAYGLDGAVADMTLSVHAQDFGALTVLMLQVALPKGWHFVRVVDGNAPALTPVAGDTGVLDFGWFPVPVQDAEFTTRIASAPTKGAWAAIDDMASTLLYRTRALDGEHRLAVVQESPVETETTPESLLAQVGPQGDASAGTEENAATQSTPSAPEGPAGASGIGAPADEEPQAAADDHGYQDEDDEIWASEEMENVPVEGGLLLGAALIAAGLIAVRRRNRVNNRK